MAIKYYNMKRFLFAAIAVLALVSCVKELENQDPSKKEQPEGTAFVKGQEVILTCGQEETKVTGDSDGAGGFTFKWQDGDQILVSVTGSPSEASLFDLISMSSDKKTATFKGFMPGTGTNFDVQWPANTPDLASATQQYKSDGIDASKMLFKATSCTLESDITLLPQYSVLRLNLYGYDRKVKTVKVTNLTAAPQETYNLSCSTSVRVPKNESGAVPFYVIVPTGTYNFSIAVTADEVVPAEDNKSSYVDGANYGAGVVVTTGNYATTGAGKTFTKGQIKNMPACCITTIWAPVNCGYDATNHPYGKLYQYGRKYGCVYNGTVDPDAGGIIQTYDNTTTDVSSMTDNTKFYKNWMSTSWPASKDPCPPGWRVPVVMELNKLLGGNEATIYWLNYATSGYVNYGHWFNGTTTPNTIKSGSSTEYEGLHLISAGFRNFENGASAYRREQGYYWAADFFGESPLDHKQKAYGIGFFSNYVNVAFNDPAMAFAVRCILDEGAASSGANLPDDMTNKTGSWN